MVSDTVPVFLMDKRWTVSESVAPYPETLRKPHAHALTNRSGFALTITQGGHPPFFLSDYRSETNAGRDIEQAHLRIRVN